MKITHAYDEEIKIEEPKREQFANNLGGAIEYRLAHFVYTVLSGFGTAFLSLVAGGLLKVLELLEAPLVNALDKTIDDILQMEGLPPSVQKLLTEIRKRKSFAIAPILIGVGSAAAGTVVTSALGVLLSPLTYFLNRKIRPARFSPEAGLYAYFRKAIPYEMLYSHLADQGWSDEAIKAFMEVAHQYLTPEQEIAYAYRISGDPTKAVENLTKLGYSALDATRMTELSKYIPPPADLVRMAVREAWNPAFIKRWGLDEEFPEEFASWAEKQGMSRDWALKYWIAHWELPSPTMVFEMLHRGLISEREVDAYLKAADYPQAWRELLRKISYNVVTRVDARRMYELGTINEQQLLRYYLDMGYNPEDAARLVQWTLKEYGDAEREETKTDILTAYELHNIRREEAFKLLCDIGYKDWIAETYLDKVDYKLAQKEAKERKERIKTLYTLGEIERAEAVSMLAALDVSSEEINKLLLEWDRIVESRVARPTVSDLDKYLQIGIIDENMYRETMKARGYRDIYIDWRLTYLAYMMLSQLSQEKEATGEQVEKLKAAKPKDEYALQKAEIDLEIKTLRAEIADKQALIYKTINEADKEKLEEQIDALHVEIANIKETIAEMEVYQTELRDKIRRSVYLPEKQALQEELAGVEHEIKRAQQLIRQREVAIAEKRAAINYTVSEAEKLSIKQEIANLRAKIASLEVEKMKLTRSRK